MHYSVLSAAILSNGHLEMAACGDGIMCWINHCLDPVCLLSHFHNDSFFIPFCSEAKLTGPCNLQVRCALNSKDESLFFKLIFVIYWLLSRGEESDATLSAIQRVFSWWVLFALFMSKGCNGMTQHVNHPSNWDFWRYHSKVKWHCIQKYFTNETSSQTGLLQANRLQPKFKTKTKTATIY